MPKDEKAGEITAQLLIDDEPDDWCVNLKMRKSEELMPDRDKRIFSTGCAGTRRNRPHDSD
jgi:hypothetical protein